MKSLIGVTANSEQKKLVVRHEYLTGVIEAGGMPVVLPYLNLQTDIQFVLGQVQGLLISGGSDIDPNGFGEEPRPGLGKLIPERDQFELLLIQEALMRKIPILAICRGMHMLNVAAGGNLYQDLPMEFKNAHHHYQDAPRDASYHSVQINKGSKLYQASGSGKIRVNSFHHQAVKTPAPGFQMTATAGDGVIEAIEKSGAPFVVGVQWHPGSLTKKEAHARGLFHSFIKAAETYTPKS